MIRGSGNHSADKEEKRSRLNKKKKKTYVKKKTLSKEARPEWGAPMHTNQRVELVVNSEGGVGQKGGTNGYSVLQI